MSRITFVLQLDLTVYIKESDYNIIINYLRNYIMERRLKENKYWNITC